MQGRSSEPSQYFNKSLGSRKSKTSCKTTVRPLKNENENL